MLVNILLAGLFIIVLALLGFLLYVIHVQRRSQWD